MTTHHPIGVLMMAYGGPNSLAEIPGYLADIRSGRPTPQELVAEITSNYRQIGGKSPLLERTLDQVRAVSERFDPDRFKFYLGMRHWSPWIAEAVHSMLRDGITQAVSIVLAPHYSKLSVAKYQAKIEEALDLYRGHIEFAHVHSFHDSPKLIQALANRVQGGLERWKPEERSDVHVIFSAHSLPERILKMGDLYRDQLLETACLVAHTAGLPDERWMWSYQSAGRSPEPWLGPQLPDVLPELAGRGIKNVVCVPIGFVSDHVEILFDIDIHAQRVARDLGMRLERPPSLNDDPLFIDALADAIHDCATAKGFV